MGFFDPFSDGLTVPSNSHHRRSSSRSRQKRHRSRSRSRSRSRDRGSSFVGDFFGGGDSHHSHKHSSSTRGGSFFGMPLGNSSRSSFFGSFGRPSYYKRSPRKGFIHRSYKQLKRLLRDLIHWAKRHPVKVFFMVIMPLITGGALTALLARFGLRMPPAIERWLGMASRAASGDSFGLVGDAMRMAGGSGSRGGFDSYAHYDRHSSYGGGGDGWGNGIMGVAKMFI